MLFCIPALPLLKIEGATKLERQPSDHHNSRLGNQNDPLEDYEAYIARQKKVFDAEDQKLTAQQIFDDLASKNAEMNPGTMEVLEPKFREALISRRFNESDIDAIIKGMENDKMIERVGTELDGVVPSGSSSVATA